MGSYASAMTKPKMYLARDVDNNTHLVKLKPGASNGRPPHPKKKKHRKSGISPEEAFEREYFSKPKHKPSHGDYADGSASDYDEEGSGDNYHNRGDADSRRTCTFRILAVSAIKHGWA